MDAYENDDYLPDEGHLVSGKPRRSKHIEAGGPGGRPGQRGKNKREHGEKPVVTVKWGPQLTEQLWALIKTKPELKKVLVNEPTRFLGPHGAAGQLFSKKDLQRTIAEHLFGEGQYDLSDQVIVDNLTRAVKNKLHKTQMLYEASLRELPSNFAQYQSESEIPHALRAKWAKVKDRFPTYFEYHELAQEIPTITAQMEIDAQKLGAWKAKALSGSEDGSPGSFLSNRQRSRSIDTSASWDAPEFEGSPTLPHRLLPDDQDFEVLPPPADQRANLSDLESVGIPNATPGIGIGGGLGSISPGLSPISPNARHLNLQGSGRWSPSLPSGPVMPMGLSQPMVVNPMRPASADNLPHQWSPLAENRNPGQQASLDNGAYDGSILQGAWTTEPSSLVPNLNGIGSRYPAIPMTSIPQEAGHLTAQNSLQAQESRHSSVGLGGARRRRPAHERIHSGGALSSDFPPESVDHNSPYSGGYSSTSGSPDMPIDPDSPRDDRAMEQLLQILKEKEMRKQRRMEDWLNLKQKRLEDREQQRLENQRQREENERQRQHEAQMMEQKLRLAQLEAQQRRYQSQTDSMRSGSVATNESDMQSPDQSIAALTGFGPDGSQTQGHQMQYPENMMLFSTPMPSGQPMMDHSIALMGSHTPVQQGMIHQQQQQGQRKHGMNALGMGQFQQSPITGQGFGEQGFSDAQLDELLGGGMHHGHSGAA